MFTKSHARGLAPAQNTETNTATSPVRHARTIRYDDVSAVTSGYAGKFLPVAMIPLLREDRAMNSMLTLNFQMAETADMLLNPVRASASAWLVPKMAFERFQHGGYGAINRSYNGVAEIDDQVIEWFEAMTPAGGSFDNVWEKLGIHYSDGQQVNSDYVEAYNCVWNHIARNQSKDIPLRAYDDQTIAPAFWEHTQLRHVKATFDDAMMEGQVPLTIVNSEIDLKGFYRGLSGNHGTTGTITGATPSNTGDEILPENAQALFKDNVGGLFAELAADSVQVSLANIDLARETAAWARMRTRFQGLSDEWMMDQLLKGIALPEEGMKQPILLDRQSVPFGMIQRYATDGGSLQQSATNGQTALSLRLRTPPVNTSGVIVVAVQMLPEMVYERQRDYYAAALSVSELPDRTADELDPQPVVEVYNKEVDELHSLPNDLFAYAPLNHQWLRNKPKIGGKYYRDDPQGPWDEDRNRIWDTTTVDPKLGEDFYLASNIRHDVFMSQNEDPFEIWTSGRVAIEGLTFFGPQLRESNGDYEAVLAQVDTERLDPPSTTAQDTPADD